MQPDHLILIGDFAPLTLSMLADINHAAGLSKTLHIIIQTPNHVPLPCGRTPTLFDAVRWVQMACQSFGFIKIHTFGSLALPDMSFDYRNNTQLTKHQFLAICQALNITAHTTMLGIKSSHKDTLHPFELALPKHDHASNYDDELVQNNPLAYFHQLSAVCRYFYTQRFVLLAVKAQGKLPWCKNLPMITVPASHLKWVDYTLTPISAVANLPFNTATTHPLPSITPTLSKPLVPLPALLLH